MVLVGLMTFRGYREFGFYKKKFQDDLEKSANAFFCYSITQRWIACRLDLICLSFGIFTAIFAMVLKNSTFVDK